MSNTNSPENTQTSLGDIEREFAAEVELIRKLPPRLPTADVLKQTTIATSPLSHGLRTRFSVGERVTAVLLAGVILASFGALTQQVFTQRSVLAEVKQQNAALDTRIQELGQSSVTVAAPLDGGTVDHQEAVTGQVMLRGYTAVVLVRAKKDSQPWWVENPVDLSQSGEFSTGAYFGIPSTPSGTEYEVVVLAVPAAQAANYKPGQWPWGLPVGVLHSRMITVSRQ